MPSPEQLLVGYQLAVARTRTSVLDFGSRYWNNLGSWRDQDVVRFTSGLFPVLRAGQLRTATLTAAYIRQTSGGPLVRVNREQIVSARKVDPLIEYRRPFVSVYKGLAANLGLTASVAEGSRRLFDLLTTDLQLAKTVQARESFQKSNVLYYRRVLSGSENCALCEIASGNRYKSGDLMPIHPGCDCGVQAVTDQPASFPVSELDAVHGHTDLTAASAAHAVTTHEHGEWGPTLAWTSDHFTGPAQINEVEHSFDTAPA
jgi:hypothetical protein